MISRLKCNFLRNQEVYEYIYEYIHLFNDTKILKFMCFFSGVGSLHGRFCRYPTLLTRSNPHPLQRRIKLFDRGGHSEKNFWGCPL